MPQISQRGCLVSERGIDKLVVWVKSVVENHRQLLARLPAPVNEWKLVVWDACARRLWRVTIDRNESNV
jgi:hypothetical protein